MKQKMLIDLSTTHQFNVPSHIEIMIGDFKKNYAAYLDDKLSLSISLSSDMKASEKRREEAKYFVNTLCFFAVARENCDVIMTASRSSSKRWKSDEAIKQITESVIELIEKHKDTLIHLAPYYGISMDWGKTSEEATQEAAKA